MYPVLSKAWLQGMLYEGARMTTNMVEFPQSGQKNWCFGKVAH